jgi:adenylylsulfate kinase
MHEGEGEIDMRQGVTLWLTGLVGAGKSTLARALTEGLLARGCAVEVLSGSAVRRKLSPELGFSAADRDRHVRRLGYISRLLSRNGVVTIVDAVSPRREARDQVRYEVGELVEIYLDTPLEVCEARDPRGLYARARAGELSDFPGISAPYEPPEFAELVLHPAEESVEACATRVIQLLEELQYLEAASTGSYSPEDEEKVKRRLEDLGYI